MANLHSRTTPPSLLLRLRDVHDMAAWQTFVAIYAPLVYRYCRRHRLQDADAADVTQEVLAQVARAMRTFDYQPERGRFRDWLGTVTRNKLRRFLEKQAQGARAGGGGAQAILEEVIAPEADTEWTARFNTHLLRVALERIRPHFAEATWRAFVRLWLENRPAAEVAAEAGLSVAAVYVAKSRVLRRLRAEVLLLAEDVPLAFGPPAPAGETPPD